MVETQMEHTQTLQQSPDDAFQLVDRVGATGHPLSLTVDGEVKAVVLDPSEYEHLLAVAKFAQFEEDEALRRNEEDIRAGRTKPVDEVFAEIRKKYAISR